MKKIILSSFVSLLMLASAAQTTKRALFIGNSYTAYNNLPQLTADIALSAGDTLIFDSNTPGGTTFQDHTSNSNTLNKISAGNWDFVVLQEQSQLPSFPISQVETECFPFAAQLNDSILTHSPCAETVFYMTWGREDGDAQNCDFWPPVCTYEGMDDLLRERYIMLAEMNEAVVSPVGAVWRHLRENFPDLSLYASDGSHPSQLGSYTAGVCMYTTIFRKDPLNATFDYATDNADELTVRQAVHDIVYNNLEQWFIGSYDPIANFEIQAVDQLNYIAQNTSQNASDFEWFLNGTSIGTNTDANFEVLSAEPFELTLIASNCGLTATHTENITPATGIMETSDQHLFRAFPIPADESIRISEQSSGQFSITDINGKVVLTGNTSVVETKSLQNGVYLLQTSGGVQRIVIAHQD